MDVDIFNTDCSKTIINIFLIDDYIDYDYIMPIYYKCECDNLIIFMNGLETIEEHPTLDGIRKNKEFVEIKNNIYIKSLSLIDSIFRILHLTFFNSICTKIQREYRSKKIANVVKAIRGYNNVNIINQHATNKLYENIYNKIKNISTNQSYVFIAVPHGDAMMLNIMMDISDHNLYKYNGILSKSYKHYDYVLSYSNNQKRLLEIQGLNEKNILVVSNPRYSKLWFDKLLLGSDKGILSKNTSINEVKILFVLSKFRANIFKEELFRCLHILLSFSNIKVVLKPHPRGVYEALNINKYFGNKFTIDNSHFVRAILKTDYVISTISSVILDAIYMNRLVIFPKYITSSQLDPEIENNVLSLANPDQFYECVQKMQGRNIDPIKTHSRLDRFQNHVLSQNKLCSLLCFNNS
jgi:hypothetical protein